MKLLKWDLVENENKGEEKLAGERKVVLLSFKEVQYPCFLSYVQVYSKPDVFTGVSEWPEVELTGENGHV